MECLNDGEVPHPNAPPQLRGAWWASGGDTSGQTHSLWGDYPEIMPLTSENTYFSKTYTIFEGTSEIQRLIISRAISGVHIR